MLRGLFPAADQLSVSKSLYHSGRILSAKKVIRKTFNDRTASMEEKLWYARLLSETGDCREAHDIYVAYDPIEYKELLAVDFLKNLLRWKMISQALLYVPKLKIDNHSYYEVAGDIFFEAARYVDSFNHYMKAARMGGEKDLLYYKAAKAAYKLNAKRATKKLIRLSWNHAQSRMIKINLLRLEKLL